MQDPIKGFLKYEISLIVILKSTLFSSILFSLMFMYESTEFERKSRNNLRFYSKIRLKAIFRFEIWGFIHIQIEIEICYCLKIFSRQASSVAHINMKLYNQIRKPNWLFILPLNFDFKTTAR